MNVERVETIVVGGGQAGLVTGHHLARRGLPFVILDASARIGDAWRHRWDSLLLFTPRRYAGLPGMPLPGERHGFPGKDELADYLEAYAARFRLPVRSGARVEAVERRGERFVVTTQGADPRRYECAQVVVAMANYQRPRLPPFAAALDPAILQLHSRDYRNPAQLQDGAALVVGVGNSGADIALELARSRPTLLAGRETGHIPFRVDTPLARHLLVRLVRFLGHHVLTVGTPLGRKVRPKMLRGGTPLVRVKPADLDAAGIARLPRVTGVRDGRPLLADGRTAEVRNVIWCTGFDPGFSWLHLPVLAADGEPEHERGVARVPGLFFVGLHFQYAASSATLVGVSRDAERVVRAVEARARAARPALVEDPGRRAGGTAAA